MSNDSKPNRKKRWRLARWLLGLIVVVGLISPVVYRANYRAQCGAAMMASSSFMRQASTQHTMDLSAGDPLRSVGMMIVDGVLEYDDIFRGMCYADSHKDVVIMGHSLKKIRSSKRALDALKSNIRFQDDFDTWESVGRFRFSHEAKIYQTFAYRVIVSISCYEHGNLLVGFADIHNDSVYSRHDLREIIEQDRAAREQLGLDPLIDLEKEIDDYRARKKLEPLRD